MFAHRGEAGLLVEDYADRVRAAAGYLARLLADDGTRVDNPVDEPVSPDGAVELPADAAIVEIGVDPAPGVMAAAVDGGSACLAGGRAFWVVAFRAGTVWHRDRHSVAEEVDRLAVRTLGLQDARGEYAAALARAGIVRERELGDVGGVVDVLRELAEWQRVRAAICAARPGDVVLVDGSLHPGPFLPGRFIAPIHELAVDRQVDLVGVTKASKLRWGRYAPLVLRVRRLAERRVGPDARWYVHVAGDQGLGGWRSQVYVARLACRGAWAFRVDLVCGARTPDDCFAVLAGLSDDPAFLGYPYPLARAHQLVALPGHLLADLRCDLREACLREGLSEDDVDLVLRDFHQTLNA